MTPQLRWILVLEQLLMALSPDRKWAEEDGLEELDLAPKPADDAALTLNEETLQSSLMSTLHQQDVDTSPSMNSVGVVEDAASRF
ncbi:hypothetical protein BN1708_004331 [Verticillium longisporum]|uniref:Uncharacterized protein n=1 Tax=Verticillium longisporum TaxID=100787 RepID=A0A0G4LYN5_VERLO|nr:hypothetical protein BN1708_004331 [Verticillium longisporum]